MSRAPKGRTFDPCPGCGLVPQGYRGRPKDGVCESCRLALDRMRQAQEEAAERGDEGVYLVPERDHWLPYLPHELSDHNAEFGNRELVRSPLLRLTRLVSVPVDNVRAHPPGGFPAVFEAIDRRYSQGGGNELRRMPAGVRDALRELFTGIARSLEHAHAEGHDKGRSLLLGLASGNITSDQFNEAAARLPRPGDKPHQE